MVTIIRGTPYGTVRITITITPILAITTDKIITITGTGTDLAGTIITGTEMGQAAAFIPAGPMISGAMVGAIASH
jgi:hypothetical protein